MRLLLVEDDAELAASLHRGLEELGMAVDTAGTGDQALAAAAVARYDVIVLAVMLPGGRDRFLGNVWDFDLEDGDNLVEVYIGRLRRKLAGASAGDPITTIRGAGYRFDGG